MARKKSILSVLFTPTKPNRHKNLHKNVCKSNFGKRGWSK